MKTVFPFGGDPPAGRHGGQARCGPRRRAPFGRCSRGLSLLETVVAMAIAAMVGLAVIAAAMTANRLSSDLPYDLFATQLLNKFAEDLRKETYDNVGTASLPAYNSPQTFAYDPDNPDRGPTFTVTCHFKGFGYATGSSTASTLEVDLAAGDPGWQADEWSGYIVMLKQGPGSGQCTYVTGNTDDRLSITRDLTGQTGVDWIQTPSSSTYFEIGGGKTVVISAAWTTSGRTHTRTFTTMLLK